MKLFFAVFLFILTLQLSANTITDSLLNRVRNCSGEEKAEQLILVADNLSDDSDSIPLFLWQALAVLKDFENVEKTGRCYMKLGNWYQYKTQHEKSVQCYLRAINLFEKCHNTELLAMVRNNIGGIYLSIRNYEQASENFEKSLTLRKSIHDSDGVFTCLSNLAALAFEKSDYKTALKNFLEMEKSPVFNKTKQRMAKLWLNIACTYVEDEQLDSGAIYYKKALPLFIEIGEKSDISQCYLNIAILHVRKGNYKQAILFAQQALLLSRETGDQSVTQSAYSCLHEASGLMGDYENAYRYALMERNVRDTIYNLESNENIAQMQAKFDAEKKEAENKNLLQQNEIQALQITRKNSWMASLAAAFVLVIGSIVVFFRHKKQKQNQLLLQLEQNMLRMQMNPHFIFNSLQAIQNFILHNESKEAARFLSLFAELTRGVLENSAKDYIPLKQEIRMLENYLSLQKLRFENRFDFKIIIDDSVDMNFTEIPPMMAQPFIENAIEHGMKGIKSGGLIEVRLFEMHGQLILEIVDNGLGMNQDNNSKEHQSMATTITKERIRLINKNSKTDFELSEAFPKNDERKGVKVRFAFAI